MSEIFDPNSPPNFDDFFMCTNSWTSSDGERHRCDNTNEVHVCKCCCGEKLSTSFRPQTDEGSAFRP